MRSSLLILLIISHLYVPSNSFGQVNNLHKLSVDKFVIHIDSLIEADIKQKYIVRIIEEGRFTQTVTRHSPDSDKTDTIGNKIIGGWSKYIYTNIKEDIVYKVEYHDNLKGNLYLFFYYDNNVLIYSRLKYQEINQDHSFYRKEEYYNDAEIIFESENKKEMDEESKGRTNISLRKRGNDYLREFFKTK